VPGVAEPIDRRLDLPGLRTRRRKEAAMIRGAVRRYSKDEIVRV
jgi:hypothetical protein